MKSINPLVSVLMPAYNAAQYIRTSIDSVLNQSYQNIELLIYDDASTDETVSILSEVRDSRLRIFLGKENVGQVCAKNTLIELALGAYITFLDADDYLSPDKIYKQVLKFTNDKDLALVGTSACRVFGNRMQYIKLRNLDTEGVRLAGMSAFPAPATVMVVSSVLKDMGGFRSFFSRRNCEDHDVILRIIDKFQCAVLQEPLYFYRYHSNSFGNNPQNVDKLVMRDIVLKLRSERILCGKDSLELGGDIDLERLYLTIKNKYDNLFYRSYLDLHTSSELGSFKRFFSFIIMVFTVRSLRMLSVAAFRLFFAPGSSMDVFLKNLKINACKR